MTQIRPVADRRDLRAFVELPWRLYAADPNWVAPLLVEAWAMVNPARNSMLRHGPYRLWVAWSVPQTSAGRGEMPRAVGRILAGVDSHYNEFAKSNTGYVALFECEDAPEVAAGLFDAAAAYLSELGCETMRGPVSPTDGDSYRGLLVTGFDHPPVLRASYNPPYYRAMFEAFGLAKETDFLSRRVSLDTVPERAHAVARAMARYGFRTDPVDLRELDREAEDIHSVIVRGTPPGWSDLAPPTLGEVQAMCRELKPIARPELVRVARAGDAAIGVSVTLPDVNQITKPLRGRLFPLGWLRLLLNMRKIDTLRAMALFVVPEYRRRGVAAAMYLDTLREARRLGFRWGVGSSYNEANEAICREVEAFGGEIDAVFRMYRRPLPL